MVQKKIPTLYTRQNLNGSLEEYVPSQKGRLPTKIWQYCADGQHAFLLVDNMQIQITDPNQRRGKRHLIIFCELLSSPGTEVVTEGDFDKRLELAGEIKLSKSVFRDTVNRLNKKIQEDCHTDQKFIIKAPQGYAVNPDFKHS